MAVDDAGVVDIVSTDPSGSVVLTIADHLDWHDSSLHQRVLQEKINRYLAFIESGEILDQYPQAASKQVVIKVVMKHHPDLEGERFLERVQNAVTQANVQCRWSRVEPTQSG